MTDFLRNEIELTGRQMTALAILIENNSASPNVVVKIHQTYTPTGGTHLYAQVNRRTHHISTRGVVTGLDS